MFNTSDTVHSVSDDRPNLHTRQKIPLEQLNSVTVSFNPSHRALSRIHSKSR